VTFTVTRQRAQEVHDLARARDGLSYAFGGAFTLNPRDSTDCSGLVLQTAAWYGGRTDWPGNRYGSTESFRLDHKIVYDLGFKRMPPGGPAALPFKPVMLVGLQHGGGGEYSHTACTLMTMDIPGGPVVMSERGVDWESHGNVNGVGVSLYDGARAWNDPLFHDFWYLDAKLEDAPAGPGSPAAVDVLARATGLAPARAAQILPTMSDGLRQAQCTTPVRSAQFIAHTGHESANFNATEEYASGAAYEGRCSDLGNCQPGDGVRFKGRTWIQITGRTHYAEFSQWAFDRGLVPSPTYFVDRPTELADLRWAGIGAAWYWTVSRPMNALVDAGENAQWGDYRGFAAVTAAINGGTTGIDERRARYNRAIALGDQLLTLTAPTESVDPLEELLMMELESLSPFATPGEPKIRGEVMLQAIDAVGHRLLVLDDCELGDEDAILRLVRAARGKDSKYTDPASVRKWRAALTKFIRRTAIDAASGDATALQILAHLEAKYPDVLQAYNAQNGASK
jgi:predicted chitinase